MIPAIVRKLQGASRGGKAGTGDAKRRSYAHYVRIGKKGCPGRLTPDLVKSIRDDTITPHATLGRKHGLSTSMILLIRSRKRYKSVV